MKERPPQRLSPDTQPIPTVTELRVVGSIELTDDQLSFDSEHKVWVFHTKVVSDGGTQVVRLEIPEDKIKVFSSPDTTRLCNLSNARHILFLRRDSALWNRLLASS